MVACSQCVHFRRLKPASQLLAQAVSTTDAAVSNALVKMQEDEGQQRASEAQMKSKKDTAGEMNWGFRPVMSDYCGLREAQETYLIAEVKNLGGRCEDFQAGRPERRSCMDCAHRETPSGWETDLEMEKTFAGMSTSATSVGMSTSTSDNLLNKHREGVASRKAFEIAGAYTAKGIMATRPKYLDFCKEFSRDDEFVVCLFQNPHATCSAWTKAAEAPPAATPAPQPAPASPAPAIAAPPPSPTPPPAVPAAPPPVPALARPVTPQVDEIVVPGPNPLRASMVNDFALFLEWILEVKLTPDLRALCRDSMVTTWKENDADGMHFVQSSLELLQQVRAVDRVTQDYWRESNQQNFVDGLRTQRDDLSVGLLRLYDAVNAPLAPGNPPLTRESADCFMDVLAFMRSVALNAPYQPLPRETKEPWLRQLIRDYPAMAPAQRAWIGQTPLTWRALQASWPQLTPEEKAQYRETWIRELGPMLGLPRQSTVGPQPTAYQTQGYPGAYATPAPAPVQTPMEQKSSAELIKDIYPDDAEDSATLTKKLLEAKKRGDDQEAARLQMELMRSMQRQQEMTSLLSNISNMMHQSSMAIINNMKA